MVKILEIKEVFSVKNFVLPRQYTNGIVAIQLLLLKPFVFTTTLVCVGKDSGKSTSTTFEITSTKGTFQEKHVIPCCTQDCEVRR